MSFHVINVEATCANIKRLCEEKGLSPTDIAIALRFTSTTAIYKWYSGRNIPSLDSLVEITNLLDCSLEEILIIDQIEE